MKNIGYGFNENCIEWIKDSNKATLSLSQKRVINKVEQYAEKRPEEVVIVGRNDDGSICAHIPVSWIKISPPRVVSEEQREKAREVMQTLHLNRGSNPCENDSK